LDLGSFRLDFSSNCLVLKGIDTPQA